MKSAMESMSASGMNVSVGLDGGGWLGVGMKQLAGGNEGNGSRG